jgi:CHASE3 domain sensor protein
MRKPGSNFSRVNFFLVLVVIILLGVGAYFYWKIGAQDKKLDEIQTSMVDNNTKLSGIVNYLNSLTANQQQ